MDTDCSSISSGNLKRFCAAAPPSRSSAARPELAQATAIPPSMRTVLRRRLKTKVFPQPPMASKKKKRPFSPATAGAPAAANGGAPACSTSRTASYAARCSTFSRGTCRSTRLAD
eukprot:8323957-Pyramimonas_sp.AAC.1